MQAIDDENDDDNDYDDVMMMSVDKDSTNCIDYVMSGNTPTIAPLNVSPTLF